MRSNLAIRLSVKVNYCIQRQKLCGYEKVKNVIASDAIKTKGF